MGVILSFIKQFDQSYRIPPPVLTEKNLPDQTGKVFLITGANAGVGHEVSRILYNANGTVYMGCRSAEKAQTAIDAIKSAHPSSTGKLVFLHLDLNDLTTIKSSVETFLTQETRLDWLDNNAGVMFPPKDSKSAQNHELQLATNVLGPFLLTKLLSPILGSTAAMAATDPSSVRVSWAASQAVSMMSPPQGMQFDAAGTAKDFGGGDKAYGSSKVANWWLAHEFGRRVGNPDRVLHNAYNPGNLKSDLQRHMPAWFAKGMAATSLYPARFGAYTELWAGFAPELDLAADQGGMVIPWGRRTGWQRDDVVAEMREGGGSETLWDWCVRETEKYA